MEATCACACVTTLVCMTMVARFSDNVKQGAREAEPLNSIAHMARHRFGARGNALTFPLPLEELFLALQSHASEVNSELPLQLPRTGHELGQVARVLLKTNKEGATSEQEIKGLIHQAVVRREAGKEWGNEGGRQLPRGSKFISSPQYTTCRYTVYSFSFLSSHFLTSPITYGPRWTRRLVSVYARRWWWASSWTCTAWGILHMPIWTWKWYGAALLHYRKKGYRQRS